MRHEPLRGPRTEDRGARVALGRGRHRTSPPGLPWQLPISWPAMCGMPRWYRVRHRAGIRRKGVFHTVCLISAQSRRFNLRGDVPGPLLGLEVGNELSGDGHLPTITATGRWCQREPCGHRFRNTKYHCRAGGGTMATTRNTSCAMVLPIWQACRSLSWPSSLQPRLPRLSSTPLS